MAIWLFFRLEFGPTTAIGPHKAGMLEAIERFGSISAAAPAVDLTFRQLWRLVQSLNTHFDRPLVEIRRSGRSSGAFLTPLGKEVVARYREMERLTNQTLEKHYRQFEAAVGIKPNSPQHVPRYAQIIDPTTIDRTTKQKKRAQKTKAQKNKTQKTKTGAKKRKRLAQRKSNPSKASASKSPSPAKRR